jgi:predicted glycosyltransferase
LLQKLKIDYIDLGSYGKTPLVKMLNVPVMALKIAKVAFQYKPDIVIGIASSRICHGTLFSKSKKYIFTDTEHASEQIALFKPFATKIFTPDHFTKDFGKNHIKYPGYHELAYLHPNRFKPNPDVLRELGLKEKDCFFVLRFVSWNASHDIGQKGISLENKRKLVEVLKNIGRIIISSESPLPPEFETFRMNVCCTKMHDLLFYASLFIGEGATMASECAVLGTPAIYINSLNAGCLQEQERHQLIYSLRNDESLIQLVHSILSGNNLNKEIFRKRVKDVLRKKIDVTEYMMNIIEHPESI